MLSETTQVEEAWEIQFEQSQLKCWNETYNAGKWGFTKKIVE